MSAVAAVLAALVIGPMAAPSTPAQAAASLQTLVYEGFDYSGDVGGKNGGTGWSGAWTTDANTLQVNGTGLTYTGLTTTGGTSEWKSPGNPNAYNYRSFPGVNSGVIYFQFLSWFTASHGGGTPNIRLYYNGTQTGAIGNNDNRPNMALLDPATLNQVAVSSTPLAQLNLTVVRIDYTANSTQMWMNPNLATFDYLNPPAPSASATSYAPAIDRILPITRNNGKFDEIKVMRVVQSDDPTAVPRIPPTPPRDVKAVAGDSSAVVTWAPPESQGTDDIQLYTVSAWPGGPVCSVPATVLTCTASGLTNGASYEFSVMALSPSGWSNPSGRVGPVIPRAPAPTPTPTPEPSPPAPTLTMTGERVAGQISVRGSSTSIPPGASLEVWIRKGSGDMVLGVARPTVAEDGTFTWSRRVSERWDFEITISLRELKTPTLNFPASR